MQTAALNYWNENKFSEFSIFNRIKSHFLLSNRFWMRIRIPFIIDTMFSFSKLSICWSWFSLLCDVVVPSPEFCGTRYATIPNWNPKTIVVHRQTKKIIVCRSQNQIFKTKQQTIKYKHTMDALTWFQQQKKLRSFIEPMLIFEQIIAKIPKIKVRWTETIKRWKTPFFLCCWSRTTDKFPTDDKAHNPIQKKS